MLSGNEARGIFYAENTFVLPGYRYDSTVVFAASGILLPILNSYQIRADLMLDLPARE